MARGFATGLLHGAVIGAVALGALSLVLPPPQKPVEDAVGAPDAGVIGTPSGSEFGRGEDTGPIMPGELSRPETAPPAETVVAAEPESEPMQPAAAAPAARPETRVEDPVAPTVATFGADSAGSPDMPQDEARVSQTAPLRVDAPEASDAPAVVIDEDAAPAPITQPVAVEEPADAVRDDSQTGAGDDTVADPGGRPADSDGRPVIGTPQLAPASPDEPETGAEIAQEPVTGSEPDNDGSQDAGNPADTGPADNVLSGPDRALPLTERDADRPGEPDGTGTVPETGTAPMPEGQPALDIGTETASGTADTDGRESLSDPQPGAPQSMDGAGDTADSFRARNPPAPAAATSDAASGPNLSTPPDIGGLLGTVTN